MQLGIATLAASLLLAAPAFAAEAPSYVAELAARSDSVKLVSSDRLWSCVGVTCAAAGPADSAAKRICSRLAREIGPLKAFSARGRVFNQQELAACNAKAAPVAVAAAH